MASESLNLSQVVEDCSSEYLDSAICGFQRPGAKDSSRHCQALIDSIQKFHDYAALNQEAVRKIVKKFDKRFRVEFCKELTTCPPSMPYTAKDIQAKLLIPAYRCLRCMREWAGNRIERPLQQFNFWARELSAGCDLLRLRFDLSKPEGAYDTVVRLQLFSGAAVQEPDDLSLLVKNTFISLSKATSRPRPRSQSTPPAFCSGSAGEAWFRASAAEGPFFASEPWLHGSSAEDLLETHPSEPQQEYYSSPTSSVGDDSQDYQPLIDSTSSGGTSWGSVPMVVVEHMMCHHPLQTSAPPRDFASFAAAPPRLSREQEFSGPVEPGCAAGAWSPAAGAAAAATDWGGRQRFIDPEELRGVAEQRRQNSDTPSARSRASISTVATESGSASAVSGHSSSAGNEAAWGAKMGQQRQQPKVRRPGKQAAVAAAFATAPAFLDPRDEVAGRRPGLQPPPPSPAGVKASRWWTQQPATCPISGFPINLLPYPPFKLRINADSSYQYALIDPLYFALEILSTWNFQAGGRTLTAQDISALDLHIRRCKLGPWRLGEAFELFRAGSREGHGELEDLRAKAFAKLELIRKIQHNRRRHLDLD